MFSQRDEEQYILEYFGDKADGRFLDIGAADGKTFSNTHALALRGWGGHCFEPNPHMLAPLLMLYKDRPDIAIYAAAVVPDLLLNKLNPFHATQDFVGTLSDEHRDKWNSNQGVPYRDVFVHCLTPLGIPQLHYDMVSIDVEGGNYVLLGNCPLAVWSPQLLCIEHDNHADQMAEDLAQFGLTEIHRTAENLICARAPCTT